MPLFQVASSKDAYNFYHLQLQIRIECTFGIFTHRWSILRSVIPINVSIRKTVTLVVCLAKLHNFCINVDDAVVLSSTASDELQHEINGAVPMVPTDHSDSNGRITPRQLLDGGNHFDDIAGIIGRYNRQQRYNYISKIEGTPLPQDRLHDLVSLDHH